MYYTTGHAVFPVITQNLSLFKNATAVLELLPSASVF
jgi:hypothetical protein